MCRWDRIAEGRFTRRGGWIPSSLVLPFVASAPPCGDPPPRTRGGEQRVAGIRRDDRCVRLLPRMPLRFGRDYLRISARCPPQIVGLPSLFAGLARLLEQRGMLVRRGPPPPGQGSASPHSGRSRRRFGALSRGNGEVFKDRCLRPKTFRPQLLRRTGRLRSIRTVARRHAGEKAPRMPNGDGIRRGRTNKPTRRLSRRSEPSRLQRYHRRYRFSEPHHDLPSGTAVAPLTRLRRRERTAASACSQASSVVAFRLAGLALSLDSNAVAAAFVVADAFDM